MVVVSRGVGLGRHARTATTVLALLLASSALRAQTPAPAPTAQTGGGKEAPGEVDPKQIQVPPPPFTEGIFPCTQCHDGKTVKLNTTRRKLVDMHDDIVLKHGPENRWCLDCHSAEHRDQLHLVDGTLIDFSRSFVLCGQCHGDKYRDWKVGVHGKRTGHWNGEKQYLLCVNCHNPHSPHFKPLKPLPPPTKPSDIEAYQGGKP
jgi:hypothetical protein